MPIVSREKIVRDKLDRPMPGVSVLVYNTNETQESLGLATVYAQDGVTEIAQPLTTDETGSVSIVAESAFYNVEYRIGGALLRQDDLVLGDDFLRGAPGPPGGEGLSADTRTEMAELTDVDPGDAVQLREKGYEGSFIALESNPVLEADAAADVLQANSVVSIGAPGTILVRKVDQITPYHAGFVKGETTPAQLGAMLQSIATYCAGGRAGFLLPEIDGMWVSDRMLQLPDGFRGRFDGILRNGAAFNGVNSQNVISTGEYAYGYTSPGWTAGTAAPMAPASVVGDTVTIGAGMVGDALIADIIANGIGYKLFIGTDKAYTAPIGAGGSGGVGTIRHMLQWVRVADLAFIGERKVVLDAVARQDFTAGVIGRGESIGNQTGITGGSTFYRYHWADEIRIEGKGGIDSDGVSYARSGSRNVHINLGYHRGNYGLGGNGSQDGSHHWDEVIATEKLWDVAAQSANMEFSFNNMVVAGSNKASSDSSFNENANGIIIRGGTLTVADSSIAGGLFKWTYARNCGWSIARIRARKITSPPFIVGAANVGTSTFTGGPVDARGNWCEFEQADFGGAPISRFVNIPAQHANINVEGFEMRRGRMLGFPTTNAAQLAGGNRTLIGVDFQNGDIQVTTATATIIRSQLDNGRLQGQTTANTREANINGAMRYPGALKPAEVNGNGAIVNAAIDALLGRTSDSAYETWISVSNATGIAVQSPTNAVEGRQLTLRIRNRNASGGGNIPVTFASAFIGGTLADVQPLRTSIITFTYDGSRWIATSKLENQAIPGPNLVADPGFDDSTKWTPSAGTASVTDGLGKFSGTTSQTSLTPYAASGQTLIAPMAGRSYQYTFDVKNYVSGSVRVQGGGVGTEPMRNANGTYSGTITATTTGSFSLIAAASTTLDVDNLSVVEL